MKMENIGNEYTWKNPYTGVVRTGIVETVDYKNEMMSINIGTETFHIGS